MEGRGTWHPAVVVVVGEKRRNHHHRFGKGAAWTSRKEEEEEEGGRRLPRVCLWPPPVRCGAGKFPDSDATYWLRVPGGVDVVGPSILHKYHAITRPDDRLPSSSWGSTHTMGSRIIPMHRTGAHFSTVACGEAHGKKKRRSATMVVRLATETMRQVRPMHTTGSGNRPIAATRWGEEGKVRCWSPHNGLPKAPPRDKGGSAGNWWCVPYFETPCVPCRRQCDGKNAKWQTVVD